ncbi:MAG: elongation factor P [Bacteroidales bacterium]|jgi:elongation factor P|nr:elongation factor P [Bacteroidales bacterium]
MALTNDIKNGMVIVYNNGLWQVVDFLHVKPGKGNTFIRTKLKNMKDGRVVENNFLINQTIETARVERRPYTFSYKDDMGYHFLHAETWEEIIIPEELINAPKYLMDGLAIEIVVHSETETPLTAELPAYVDTEVIYTEPAVKGNTSTNAVKDAIVKNFNNGANVKVPLFIEIGEKIKVDTRTGEYGGRISDK